MEKRVDRTVHRFVGMGDMKTDVNDMTMSDVLDWLHVRI